MEKLVKRAAWVALVAGYWVLCYLRPVPTLELWVEKVAKGVQAEFQWTNTELVTSYWWQIVIS